MLAGMSETKTRAAKNSVVVIGGGTGTHTVLRGLKRYHTELELTAIVSMADSGGSTGRLRDEFGQLPVGDVRMALTALAADVDQHDDLVRELFMYRFAKGGNGLSGHNFGNLLLTALTDLMGSEVAAIEAAARILRVRGMVVPVTTSDVHLRAVYDDGVVCIGEKDIDEPTADRYPHWITELSVTPAATLNPQVTTVLQSADLIVFGPGDLYTSILPNCVVDGFTAALALSSARVAFVANLMTKAGQTTGMTAADHMAEIERYSGRRPDYLIRNDAPLPPPLVQRYATEQEYPVQPGTSIESVRVVDAPLLATEEVVTVAGDTVRRSLIRHDSDALAACIVQLCRE